MSQVFHELGFRGQVAAHKPKITKHAALHQGKTKESPKKTYFDKFGVEELHWSAQNPDIYCKLYNYIQTIYVCVI